MLDSAGCQKLLNHTLNLGLIAGVPNPFQMFNRVDTMDRAQVRVIHLRPLKGALQSGWIVVIDRRESAVEGPRQVAARSSHSPRLFQCIMPKD
jgi:hypothetical protein